MNRDIRRRPRSRRSAPTQTAPLDWKALLSTPRVSRRDALLALAIAAMSVVAYLPAILWGGFVWDDVLIFRSEVITTWPGIWDAWFSPGSINNEAHYWPIVYTTFWIEHKLYGADPTGYHAFNVLLHVANSLLLWRVCKRLGVPGAWLIAAVFAVHPLHVESVAWVIERKDVLSGVFYLAAALAWLRFSESPANRWPWYALSLALFVAGMLSKSMVVTLPAALLIVQWWKNGRVTSEDLKRLAPFFVIGLAIAAADSALAASLERIHIEYSLVERPFIAARALWWYAAKLAWPLDLEVIYPLWDISVADPIAWLYLVGAVALAAALWLLRERIGRGPLAGALFFAVTLSPILGFVDYGYMQFSLVADRYQYLAAAGLIAVAVGAAAYGVSRLPDERGLYQKGALVAAVALLAVFTALSWRHADIYRDQVTFFSYVVSQNPQGRDANLNLASGLMEQRRPEEALKHYQIAVEQRPDHHKPHYGEALALGELGRLEEAEAAYMRALEIRPDHEGSAVLLSELYLDQTRYEEALKIADDFIAADSNSAQAYTNKGLALHHMDRNDEAEQAFLRALRIDNRHVGAISGLGGALFNLGRHEDMLLVLETWAEIEPDNPRVHSNMGIALAQLGRFDEALNSFDHALSIDPDYEEARANRANLLQAQ